MSGQQTIDTSEECLLGRCESCSGDALMVSTSRVSVRVPCRCICHPVPEN